MANCGYRNFMDEMREIICEIEKLKPEPEICNARCPPFGCPAGPCPGMCCYGDTCDACCVSQMPCSPQSKHPPRCRPPPGLLAYAKSVGYPPESCLSWPQTWKENGSCPTNKNFATPNTSPFSNNLPSK